MRCINVIISVLLVSTAIFGIYHIVVLFSNINAASTTEPLSSEVVECNENVSDGEPCFGLAMTTRNEWLAQPPHNPIDKLNIPAKRIILTITKTDECSEKSKCNYLVRNIQENHLLSSDDIDYSFLINTQGDVYEGRGWTSQSAEQDNDLRVVTYWIAFIGNFTTIPAWEKQVKSMQDFTEHAVSIGKLNVGFNIFCPQGILIFTNNTDQKFSKFIQCSNIN